MAKAQEKKNEVATTEEKQVPAFLNTAADADAGKGVSTAQEDNTVPLIYVLQTNSRRLRKSDPDFLEGGKPGDILLRNSAKPLVNGEEGILFQPCFFVKDWVEWIPRDDGGGFVGRHKEIPKDAKKVEDPQNPAKVKYVRPNGNEVIETRNHVGRVFLPTGAVPYVLPLTSTGHTVSRNWMFMMNQMQMPNGKKAPSWAGIYRLKTKERSNAQYQWYTLDVEFVDYVQTEDDYNAGKKLFEAFDSGVLQADKAEERDVAATDTGEIQTG